jgi:hypothetical protein
MIRLNFFFQKICQSTRMWSEGFSQ